MTDTRHLGSSKGVGYDPAADVYRQRIAVPFDYPVHFTHGLFDPSNDLLASVLGRLGENRRHRAAVVLDAALVDAWPGLTGRVGEYFHSYTDRIELAGEPKVVPGGERVKNGWEPVRDLMWTFGNLHLDRQSYVIAVGGGAMLDMAGFAASLIHRGLRLVRVPTTVLAQNDGGVGVKNGMDEHGQKNFVGTFAPPFAVVNDFDFLATLADRDWIGGIAEAFKVALIRDAEFFAWLCAHAAALRRRDRAAMEQLVRRCAILHLEHIRTSGDPFETGSARPLDFGHWSAHKIETLSGYEIGHGQAVALGIAIDTHYAMQHGLLGEPDVERVLAALDAAGLPTWDRMLQQRRDDGELAILDGLVSFREHLGGALNVTLPDGVGHKVEVHHVDTGGIEAAVRFLRTRAEAHGR